MLHPTPPLADREVAASGPEQAFDVRTSRALGQASRPGRLIFALIYAVLGLSFLPLSVAGLWLSVVIAWELVSSPLLDHIVTKLSNDTAISAYAVINFLGSGVFGAIAFMGLADGSPMGVAIATTWLGGSFVNQFVYFGSNRRVLWSCLIPGIAITLAGPLLAHGFSLTSVIISVSILAALMAAQAYALDHRAVVNQLADRQIALVGLERKLSIAIEASGDGLFETNVATGETQVSPTWSAMLGYEPGELPTPIPNWREFVHPEDLPALNEDYAAHLRDETSHTTSEFRMRCKDGEFIWVLARARLVARTADGRPLWVVGTTMDISERKALEHQLEGARDLAESANRAKSVFVANMSHEIRTPLNGVIGVAGALARTELSADQREMVALVQSSGQVLERLLSDILDQARIEVGHFQLEVAAFDLRHEIDAAAELLRARADEKGLGFHLTYTDAAQGVFDGDAVRVRQIVANLASNAIKFSAAGAITIAVDAVVPEQAEEPMRIRIEVADTGIGFDAETAKRLFSRFVQADGSISRQFGGTGLGLAICKSLTELMGGRIDARSEPGVGSTFTVEIPLRPAAFAEKPPGRSDELAGDLAKVRVLLAEDHPTNQRVVQLILEPAGVELTIVGNGQEAVDAFRAGRFDLILMDMQMPVMDGLAATRAIRALECKAGLAPTTIAMFTANAMPEHLAQAVEAGADCHIAKPITPERLLAGVAAALSQDHSNNEATARAVA